MGIKNRRVVQVRSSEVPALVASGRTHLVSRVSWQYNCRLRDSIVVGFSRVQVQVVAFIAARLSGSSDSWQCSCRLLDQVVAFIAARLSGSSGSCRDFISSAAIARVTRSFTSSGGDGDLI